MIYQGRDLIGNILEGDFYTLSVGETIGPILDTEVNEKLAVSVLAVHRYDDKGRKLDAPGQGPADSVALDMGR